MVFRYQVIIPFVILIVWFLFAVLGSWLPLEPNHITLSLKLQPPSFSAVSEWLGYDDVGRPILDRLIMGANTSFFVAFGVIFVSVTLGTLIGTVSAWLGGYVDLVVVRIMDVFLAFPASKHI